MYNHKKKSFSLAEVLVTLVVIGIVAALTIPSLIKSFNYSVYVVRFKKNYSVINQAYKLLLADGATMREAVPGTDQGAAALNTIAPYLNIAKNCGTNQGCWYNSPLYFLNGVKHFEDTDVSISNQGGKATLIDGSLLYISDYQSNCNTDRGTGPFDKAVCGYISIDVNGHKGPNTWGRDCFVLAITKTGVYPWGAFNDGQSCSTVFGWGQGCAYVILTEGEMNY